MTSRNRSAANVKTLSGATSSSSSSVRSQRLSKYVNTLLSTRVRRRRPSRNNVASPSETFSDILVKRVQQRSDVFVRSNGACCRNVVRLNRICRDNNGGIFFGTTSDSEDRRTIPEEL